MWQRHAEVGLLQDFPHQKAKVINERHASKPQPCNQQQYRLPIRAFRHTLNQDISSQSRKALFMAIMASSANITTASLYPPVHMWVYYPSADIQAKKRPVSTLTKIKESTLSLTHTQTESPVKLFPVNGKALNETCTVHVHQKSSAPLALRVPWMAWCLWMG